MKLISLISLLLPVVLGQDILGSLRSQGHTSFADAIVKSGLQYAVELNGDSPVTVLVPNNAAFDSAANTIAGLNQTQLQHVLATHLIPRGVVRSGNLTNGPIQTYNTLQNLTVSVAPNNITFNGARVVTPDVTLNNGIYHVIDRVIVPRNSTNVPLIYNIIETARANNLTSLLVAIEKARLTKSVQEASGVTVFAPRNSSFAAIKNEAYKLSASEFRDLIGTHITTSVYYTKKLLIDSIVATIVPGQRVRIRPTSEGKITINGVGMTVNDIPTTQGLIHIVERVVFPDGNLSKSADSPVDNQASGRWLSTLSLSVSFILFILFYII
jgi:transforming growth factor-beta-induced protein